jgi:hypothetical protein
MVIPLSAVAIVLFGAGQTINWRRTGWTRRILSVAAIALGFGIFLVFVLSIQSHAISPT